MKGWYKHPREHALAAKGISTKKRMEAKGVVADLVKFPTEDIDYWDMQEVFTLFWVSSLSNNFSKFNFDKAFDFIENTIKQRLNEHGAFGWDKYLEYIEELYGEDLTIDNFVIKTQMTFLTKERLMEGMEDELAKSDDYYDYVRSLTFDEYEDFDSEQILEAYNGWGFETPKKPNVDDLVDRIVEQRIEEEWLLDDFMEYRLAESYLSEEDKSYLAKVASEYMWDKWGHVEEYQNLKDLYDELAYNRPEILSEKVALMDRAIDAQHVTGSIWDSFRDVDELRERVEWEYRREHGW